MVFIGTAGWTLPSSVRPAFFASADAVADIPHLSAYASGLSAVEINSSFYREHKPQTYAKWAGLVPEHFRFSVKLLRYFTQEQRLKETGGRLAEIVGGMQELGPRLGAILVQLPPSLEFVTCDADRFFNGLRKLHKGTIVLEPRHVSWADESALSLLAHYQISKVRADPERCPVPRSRRRKVEEVIYYRLHGAPEIYKSRYSADLISTLAARIRVESASGRELWCIFDNTSFGYATENALELRRATVTPKNRRSI